jgi:hypothetical protein
LAAYSGEKNLIGILFCKKTWLHHILKKKWLRHILEKNDWQNIREKHDYNVFWEKTRLQYILCKLVKD